MKRYLYTVLSLLYGLPLLMVIIGLCFVLHEPLSMIVTGLVAWVLMSTILYGGWLVLTALWLQRLAGKTPETGAEYRKPVKWIITDALTFPTIVFPLAWTTGAASCCIFPLWQMLNLGCSAEAAVFRFGMWAHIAYFTLAAIIFAIGMVKRYIHAGM